MLKKTITFTDYNGTERKEDFFFHLSKADILEWVSSTDGDYTIDEYLKRIYKEHNGKKIMETFKDLIYRSYGEKSLDGRQFIRTEEVKRKFMETEAYSVLFTELVTDAKKAAAFFNGIIPPDLAKEISEIVKNNPDGIPDEMKDYLLEGEEKTQPSGAVTPFPTA